MTTTGTRFRRIEQIVDAALERPPEERPAFAKEECADDTSLLVEVTALLDAHSGAGRFLETAAVERFKGALLAEGERVGRYTIVRVLGSGGGGTVYLAEQDQPRRHVALKAMHGGFTTETAATRFQAEADILARLQHPSIAHVYEAGVRDGMPFIVLEYVENATTILDALEGCDRSERLRLFAEVCDAVHAGHARGVVHRDLKPANILVLPSGHPKVIDFGIARVGEAGAAGDVAGTPPYMSPEQCTPDGEVDLRSDVYSLGVVLYELVSGTLPYQVSGTSIVEAARRIRNEAPTALDSGVPADLRAIVDKAMSREVGDRYASALRLADDVRLFLGHKPVSARPAGSLHALGLFVRRRRALSLSLVALGLALLLGTALSLRFAFRAERARAAERYRSYAANISAAAAAVRAGDAEAARLYLDAAPPELRRWEWTYLRGRLDTSEATLQIPSDGWGHVQFCFGPDDQLVVARPYLRSTLRLFDAANWQPRAPVFRYPEQVRSLAFVGSDPLFASDSGLRRLNGTDFDNVRWTAPTPLHTHRIAPALGGTHLVVFAGWGHVVLLDSATGRDAGSLTDIDKRVTTNHGAVSPDGTKVALARNRDLAIFDLAERDVIERAPQPRIVTAVAYSADGRRLAVAHDDGTLHILQSEDPKSPGIGMPGAGRFATSLAFSADGKRLVSGHVGELAIWDAQSGARIGTLRGHRNVVSALAILDDGRIISADTDNLKVWRPEDDPQPHLLDRFDKPVNDVSFAPGSDQVASAEIGGTVRLYDVATGVEQARLQHPADEVAVSVAFHPSGERLAVLWREHLECWWPAAGRREPLAEFPKRTFLVRWAPDGSRLAGVTRHGTVAVWDAETLRLVWRSEVDPPPLDMAFAPNGRELLTHSRRTLHRWDVADGSLLGSVGLPADCERLAVHPDGEHVALAAGRTVLILDRSGALVRTHAGMNNEGARLCYSPDGSRLAVSTYLGIVYVLAPESTAPILDLRAGTGWLWALDWSADGRHVAAGGGEYSGLESALWLWTAVER